MKIPWNGNQIANERCLEKVELAAQHNAKPMRNENERAREQERESATLYGMKDETLKLKC